MIKTYEEFNWNPFKKKYDDYLGLEDIEKIDIFNNMTGVRDNTLIRKLIDENHILVGKNIMNEFSGSQVIIKKLYLRTLYNDWSTLGGIIRIIGKNGAADKYRFTKFPNDTVNLDLKPMEEFMKSVNKEFNYLSPDERAELLNFFNQMPDGRYDRVIVGIKNILKNENIRRIQL